MNVFDIKPFHDECCSCSSDIIACIAYHYKKNYNLIFYNSCAFGYNKSGDTHLLLRIGPWDKHNLLLQDAVFNYIGIRPQIHDRRDNNATHHSIRNELEKNKPVGIVTDTYCLPWSPTYHKHHTIHHILIIGENADQFVCVDPYLSKEINSLEQKVFYELCNAIITFEIFDGNKNINPEKILIYSIKNSLRCVDGKNDFDNMRDFSKDLENMDIKKELIGYGKDEAVTFEVMAILLHSIISVSSARKGFAKFLGDLSIRNDKLSTYAECFNKISDNWMNVKNAFIKYSFRGFDTSFLNKIAKMIHDIADYEEETVSSIINQIQCAG